MTSPGLLTIRAGLNKQTIGSLAVQLTRPAVTRLFIGQPPEAVVKTVPYLYVLCAHAQRAAAQAALAVAVGEARRAIDDGELWIEFLHENLWRLLLDWPQALGLPPAKEAFANWREARLGPQRADATQTLLAGALHEMAGRCLERLGGIDVETLHDGLPELAPEPWLAYWQGCSADVPSIHLPVSVAAAYRARLVEVRQASLALAGNQPYPVAAAGADGWGVGQTQTARGVLTHAVHVEDGKVMNYRVWAPTDCHFADAGALSGLLAGGQFDDAGTARCALEQAVLALDPCLPYVLEMNDA